MATEVRKSKAMETREDLPEKTLNSSLTDRLDESPNPTTLSSLQSSAGDPVSADESHKEGDLSKETDPVSTGGSLSTTAAAVDGPVSDLERKMRRAERFGVRVQLSEEEKRSSRAERFGMGPTSHGSEKSKESEEHKRKARAERFGLPVEVDEEAKKKARSARFAPAVKDVAEEDKKKARAIRFSQPAISAPQVNGKGSSELNVATAGDSGGGT